MHQGRVQLLDMMQGGRAEDQIEARRIAERHQVADDVAYVRTRVVPGNVDQGRAGVDANNVVISLGERPRVAPRPTAGIESPFSTRR